MPGYHPCHYREIAYALASISNYLVLSLGIVFSGIGGELFVRGIVGLARWARVSPGVVAATVAAFATSSPELSVSLTAAVSGAPLIALGDALGSNVVNVALIFGIVLSISGIHSSREAVNREFLVALSLPVLIGLFALDGMLSRTDGVLLLCVFLLWILAVLLEVRKQRHAAPEHVGGHRRWVAGVAAGVGLVFLVAAGRLIVSGATGIATALEIDQFVIGATVVAVSTSVPEIATAIIAKIRGHDEIGLETILGSNIFNGLLIVSVASIISPISVAPREIALALVFGFVATAVIYPMPNGIIGRGRGPLLMGIYALYLLAMTRPT